MSTIKRVSGNYTIQTLDANDIVTINSATVSMTGNLTVTGNATLTGNISGDKLFNGTTSFEIQTAGGNANVTVSGTSNVVVFTPTGVIVTGTESVSGNVIGGNINTAGQVSAVGNVNGGNLTITTGNVLLNQTSGAATAQMIRFNDANPAVTTLGANIGSVEWYTNDATGAGPRTTAAIKAVYADNGGNANILIQYANTASLATAIAIIGTSGNVGIANVAPLHTFAVTGTIYGSSTLTAVGNVSGGNLTTAGQISATSTITGGNVLTGGLISATGNVTGGNVIITTGSTAGSGGYSATGNVTGGNVNSNGLISATGNVYAGGNLLTQGYVSATGNITGANITVGNLNVTGISGGTGIGAENIVWQSTDASLSSASPADIGVLTFTALANQAYKFNAYIPVVPDGSMTTGFSVNFAAGTCQYTVEAPTTATSTFSSVYSSNVADAMSSTQAMTGTTLRAVRVTGTFYHTANTAVTIRGQNNTGTLTIKTGSNLSYTRIG